MFKNLYIHSTRNNDNHRLLHDSNLNPASIYLLKVNNRNTRTRCEIYSKLITKTQERRHWRLSGVFIANFEHISHLVLVFLLLTLSMGLLAENAREIKVALSSRRFTQLDIFILCFCDLSLCFPCRLVVERRSSNTYKGMTGF